MKEASYAWHCRYAFPWQKVFIGTRRVWFGDVMRRKLPNGDYEYREMTNEERSDYFDAEAR